MAFSVYYFFSGLLGATRYNGTDFLLLQENLKLYLELQIRRGEQKEMQVVRSQSL